MTSVVVGIGLQQQHADVNVNLYNLAHYRSETSNALDALVISKQVRL